MPEISEVKLTAEFVTKTNQNRSIETSPGASRNVFRSRGLPC